MGKKIAYITKSTIAPSESFIVDAIRTLSCYSNIEIKLFSLGFKDGHFDGKNITSLEKKSTILLKRLANGIQKLYFSCLIYNFVKNLHEGLQKENIKSKLKNFGADIAYIDYGTIAVECDRALAEFNIPYVVHVHGYDASKMLDREEYRLAFVRMAEQSKQIIVPSNHLRRRVILAGVNASKITVCHYAPNYSLITIANPDVNANRIVALGRLTPKKNPVATLYAMAEVVRAIPNAHLDIVGSGPLEKRLRDEILKMNLANNVTLHGVLGREEAFRIISKSNIFVQHSVTSGDGDQEGFPVALAEAAAHGLPIVSTRHSGIPENVIHGETGYLVAEHDYEDMARFIVELLQNYELACEYGRHGRERILKICDSEYRKNCILNLLDVR